MAITDARTRIKAIQKRMGVPQSSFFDGPTLLALQNEMGLKTKTNETYLAKVMAIQSFLRCAADGIIGPITLTRIENFLNSKLPQLPSGASMLVSKESLEMLIAFEISSKALYEKRYQKLIWPGGHSGLTIGIGFDLGFATATEIRNAWQYYVDAPTLELLMSFAGLSGTAAKNALAKGKSIVIDYNSAISVFYLSTLPIYAKSTRKAFPGVEKLPPGAQGALLSLVYNRGASTTGSSRSEMKNIVDLVQKQDLAGIAAQITKMKRLWEGKGLPGLLARRDKEAALVAKADFNILTEDIIIV